MGESRAGVEVAGYTMAFGPAGWTGLFPGSLERVPVAKHRHQQFSSRKQGKGREEEKNALCSSIALVMRQFFPWFILKIPWSTQH